MSYSQLSSCSSDLSLDGLHRILLKLEGGQEPHLPCVQGEVREDTASHSGDMVAGCRLTVERPVYQQNTIQSVFCSKPCDGGVERRCDCNPRLASLVPATSWLAHYRWKEDLVKDIISGCTVAIMNIPQGMAYALLGNVPPVVGIYMAIFPVLVYALLGTSRHVAMGSFAVICLMTGKVVSQYSNAGSLPSMAAAINSTSLEPDPTNYSPLEVATAVTFMVAIYQVGMCVCRLGVLCSLLSDTLVNGFTAGAAIHVFTSQIKDLLGMKIPKYNGNFQIIYTYINIMKNLTSVNVAATLISLMTVSLLLLDNKYVKPWVSQRSVLPVPTELIAVVAGTLASTAWDIHTVYNLSTVGHISTGLPDVVLPQWQLLPTVAVDSLIIAVIAYIITVSMALVFAQKENYEIDANQELLAQGAGNLVGSFLSCMPFSASLSRSMVQHTVGGRTQLASVISAGILTVVLVSIAPIFEPLPRCVLASLIVVALRGVLLQVKDIVKIWRMSAVDGAVWLATYLTVIVVEVDVGLAVGLALSILTILYRGIRPYIYQLSRLPNTDIYVESTKYGKVEDINDVHIVHYAGGLNFANRNCFKEEVYKILNKSDKQEKLKSLSALKANKVEQEKVEPKMSFLVVDMSGMQYVDPSGAYTVQGLATELAELNTSVYLAAASGNVSDVLQRCGVFETPNVLCFPTVHDAVLYAQDKLPKIIHSIRL